MLFGERAPQNVREFVQQHAWYKIAGRGKLGDMNWGADFSSNVTQNLHRTAEKLKEHTGEKVLLTGGGGYGYNVGVLTGAEVDYARNAVRVHLRDLQPKMGGRTEFSPLIGSWQISVQGSTLNPPESLIEEGRPIVENAAQAMKDYQEGRITPEQANRIISRWEQWKKTYGMAAAYLEDKYL